MAVSTSIQALIAGETVAGSRISNRLLTELIQEGLLQIIIHGSRKSYRANNIEALKRFLIDKDENYRILDVGNSESRSAMASETGNSKLVTIRSCPGFPVNTYESIECRLNEEPFIINPQEGCFFLFLIGELLQFQMISLSLELRIWRISEKFVNKDSSSMSIYINMDFHKRYCSSHAIHNQLILENGWHLSPIHISTLATLIWLVFIYSCLNFRSI